MIIKDTESMYIISRCLLGHKCKYDGGDNLDEGIAEFCRTHDYVTICPETAAGLRAPREPAEIVPAGEGWFKVISRDGKDLTRDFDIGAEISLRSVLIEQASRVRGSCVIEGAILKARSPSCGAGRIYDGSFSGQLTEGNGVFTDKLIDAFIEERKGPEKDPADMIFADDFRICDEENWRRFFSDR